MTDILERIYDFDNHGITASDRFHLRKDAGDEIARLRADVQRLQAELAGVWQRAWKAEGGNEHIGGFSSFDYFLVVLLWLAHLGYRAAR